MAAKLDGKTISIVKWDEYNPRKNLKATSWVRLQNSLFEDPQFFDFSHSEICFWIYLISQASKKQTGRIRFSTAHAERIGRFSIETIVIALEKLQRLQCVIVDDTGTTHACDTDDTRTTHACDATDGRTDERNVTDETNVTHEKRKPDSVSDLGKEIQDCTELWGRVKRHFGIERGLLPNEQAKIGAAIKRHGVDSVVLAFEGARAEKASEEFNPADHLSLTRILDPLKLERFVNLGAKARKLAAVEAEKQRRLEAETEDVERPDPERVRSIIAKAFPNRGGA